ncbi:hypothetical protein PR048_029162 [Dryococelus australis]|uniref:DDE-1 domain-containing protein n=1 Tax=Dryococelus australis TaxID=614101 RepID=A0ABQ9GCK3_9NEOP|nr:hypothetical protein PR048_029162 [Dryococelus australis]
MQQVLSPHYFLRMQERLLDGAPPGCQAACTDDGWINAEVFLQWHQFFVEQVRPRPERKVLLIFGKHEPQKCIKTLDFAKENNVLFLSFPHHTTHKMQPLDIAVYGPLKLCFEQAICTFQKNHPGRIVNQYDVAILKYADENSFASAKNAVSGFRSSGIWPYNPHILSDADYVPASVTDHPEHEYASDIRNGLSETTSLPPFAPVHPNCDSASNVRSGQPTNFNLPAPLITIPDPGSYTDIRKFDSETGISSSIPSPPQPEIVKPETCFGDKPPC